MRVLLRHVHGSWTNSFVRGGHEYFLVGGRMGREWPAHDADGTEDVDVLVAQQPDDLALARDVPVIYVEHNTPRGERHPMADRPDIRLVHVTHFNDLMWDTGSTSTTVIEHGVVDPGDRYTGELERAGVVINEPVRRWRVTGTDLLRRFDVPLDVFGMGLDGLRSRVGDHVTEVGDLPLDELHDQLARRRLYLHTTRWTSLGLSLVEAMHLGMPVVALATTEAVMAVPPEAGVCSTNVADLVAATGELMADAALARRMGKQAREFALARYGLGAFLEAWDELLAEVSR